MSLRNLDCSLISKFFRLLCFLSILLVSSLSWTHARWLVMLVRNCHKITLNVFEILFFKSATELRNSELPNLIYVIVRFSVSSKLVLSYAICPNVIQGNGFKFFFHNLFKFVNYDLLKVLFHIYLLKCVGKTFSNGRHLVNF